MDLSFTSVVGTIGTTVEGLGVLVIVAGLGQAVIHYGYRYLIRAEEGLYALFRRDAGRALMVGLEFLVAGDIIRTVVTSPTIEDIAALGLLVLVRTVLVFTIHLEVEGRWPWQPESPGSAGAEKIESK